MEKQKVKIIQDTKSLFSIGEILEVKEHDESDNTYLVGKNGGYIWLEPHKFEFIKDDRKQFINPFKNL